MKAVVNKNRNNQMQLADVKYNTNLATDVDLKLQTMKTIVWNYKRTYVNEALSHSSLSSLSKAKGHVVLNSMICLILLN